MTSQSYPQDATLTHATHIKWSCEECEKRVYRKHMKHHDCGALLTWTCVPSGRSGLYNNLYRHEQRCDFCCPAHTEYKQQQEEDEKALMLHMDQSQSYHADS